ncbi:MAG: DNA polymerase III subunit gamma/tau [Chlamydiae bacterium]|nr:DNA polymerase III subunit gamma/tau [Chlamydiota bacterium]
MSSIQVSDSYQVIARKYRPQTFMDVIAQEPVVTTLKNAIRLNRTAHAYLFCGCRGTGKTTLARVFAKALNCHNRNAQQEPCNQCPSCLDIVQSRSLDVIEIDGASHRGIDDIRQINETIAYAPSSGKFKIYIIDEVHMLTKEAFNALLKTLEEPPHHVKFFFATTEPHKVLQTILSRCQRFNLSRIPLHLIEEKLAKIGNDLGLIIEKRALQTLAKLSEGSLRDAESLFDQVICYNEGVLTAEKVATSLGLIHSSTFFEFDQAVAAQDLSAAFTLAEKIFVSGKDISYFLDSLLDHFRTILSIHIGNTASDSSPDLEKYVGVAKNIYPQDLCLYILDYLILCAQQMSKGTSKRIHLEMILLHIIRSKKRVSIETLVYSLKQMQSPSFTSTPTELKQNLPQALTSAPTTRSPTQEMPKIADNKEKHPIQETLPTEKKDKPISTAIVYVEPAPILEVKSEADNTKGAPVPSAKEEETTNSLLHYKPQIKHETVIRFAAVELDGIFSKN